MLSLRNTVFHILAFAVCAPTTHGQGGEFQGGPGGPGFGGGKPADDLANFVSIACEGDIDFSCDLPRGNEEGIFVCRSCTHPVSSETNTVPVCIPTDKALESDECRCCGEVCPTECDSCPCELSFNGPDGVPKEGIKILVEGMDEPLCVPKFASWMMVSRDDEVTCNTDCN